MDLRNTSLSFITDNIIYIYCILSNVIVNNKYKQKYLEELMKIISTIVDSNYILYGLELAGRSSKFKEEGKDIIRKVMTLNKLIDNRFKNSQIACLKKALKVLDGEQSEIIKKL